MRLTELVDTYAGEDDPEIKGLTLDSRRVEEGWLFAALPGSKSDGQDYIDDAIHLGAVAVLAPTGAKIKGRVAVVTDDNPRHRLARMAADFYERQPETIVAVTGTNGKTSTVHFAHQLWGVMAFKAASLGTLGIVRDPADTVRSGSLTTPDPVSLHAELADLASSGVTHLAMEASSHGLDQRRLDGVRATAAGFTNLSHDHLDYHGDMEEYLAAKTHLFKEVLQESGAAVLNADVPEFEALSQIVTERGCRVISYGHDGVDIKVKSLTATPKGQQVALDVLGQSYDLNIPLVGEFQVMNALCALGLVLAEDDTRASGVVPHLENLKGVPGRLQLVPGHSGGAVYVDYAHTPDALEHVLKALRPHTEGRLICLMGCGGDRDADKRPVMGKIAGEQADMIVITDDNPRHEDPKKIREDIKAGISDDAVVMTVPYRGEAIISAVQELKDGDVLLIAGKGHEQGQIIGEEVKPFDDVEFAINAIEQSEGY